MVTPYLHDNFEPCEACDLRQEAQQADIIRFHFPCNHCKGLGYVPLSIPEIIHRTVAQARATYWSSKSRPSRPPE